MKLTINIGGQDRPMIIQPSNKELFEEVFVRALHNEAIGIIHDSDQNRELVMFFYNGLRLGSIIENAKCDFCEADVFEWLLRSIADGSWATVLRKVVATVYHDKLFNVN